MTSPPDPSRLVAFQGVAGAYSDLACRQVFPERATSDTFVASFMSVQPRPMFKVEEADRTDVKMAFGAAAQ